MGLRDVSVGLVMVAAGAIAVGTAEKIISPVAGAWSDWNDRRNIQRHWPALVAEGSMISGKRDAVVMVEFGDYQCPACRRAHESLTQLLGDQMDVVAYRHFPLERTHRYARPAALASICAERQGAFRTMHERLFERTDWSMEPDWREEAEQAGVTDTAQFDKCMRSGSAEDRLNRDLELARRLDLRGTPSFVTSRRIVWGLPSDSILRDLLQLDAGQ